MSYSYHLRFSQGATQASQTVVPPCELEFEGPQGEALQPMLSRYYTLLCQTLSASVGTPQASISQNDGIQHASTKETFEGVEVVPSVSEETTVSGVSSETDVVAFQTLEELLQEFTHITPMVLLLAGAFFLSWRQGLLQFQLRDINRLLVQQARPPMTHPLLEEALREGYIAKATALQQALQTPITVHASEMYSLTESGKHFLETFLK
jgi:hypothetical protein